MTHTYQGAYEVGFDEGVVVGMKTNQRRSFVKGFIVANVLWLGTLGGIGIAQAHGEKAGCAAEDEIKVVAEFSEGHKHYTCVHRDDFVAAAIENGYRNPAVSRTVRGSVCEHPRFWSRQHGITVMPEACS